MTAQARRPGPQADAGLAHIQSLIGSAPDLGPLPSMQLRSLRAGSDQRWATGDPALPSLAHEEGVPVMHGAVIEVDRELVRELARALATDAGANPDFLTPVGSDPVDPLDLLHAAITADERRIEYLGRLARVEPRLLGVIAQLSALPLLLAGGKQVAMAVAQVDWSFGYCPVCGAWPTLAESRGLEREQWLRCGRCASGWQFGAGRCVYCGEDDHNQLGYLAAEKERESRRATSCERCLGYVKTFASLGPLSAAEIHARDLSSIDLDAAAMEAGYGRPSVMGYKLDLRIEPGRTTRLRNAWAP